MGKNFYHSALVKEGDIDITLTCAEPIASKFKDKPPFVSFKYNGEEWYYPIENEACGEALSGYKGKTITIRAEGGRDDATIEVLGGAPQQAPQHHAAARGNPPPQRQQQTQRQQPPARRTPEEKAADEAKAFKKMRMTGARVAVVMECSMRFALGVAARLRKDYPGTTFTPEDIEKIAVTHFIETKSYVDINALPTAFPETPAAGSQPPARQPAPPPEPEPEEEPEPEQPDNDEDLGEVPW